MNDDVDAPARRPTELIVEPTRLGGRRSTLPALIAALVAAAFIGTAVWKPWGAASDGRAAARSASPAATEITAVAESAAASGSGAFAAASSGDPSPSPVDPEPFPSDERLLAATTREPVWGLRALVVRGDPPGYPGEPRVVERWTALDDALVAGSADPAALTVSQADDDVAALGVTTLDDDLALGLRFWRLSPEEPPQRLAPVAIAGPEAGSWLWLADPAHRTVTGTWPAGTYAIDVLTSRRIVRLRVDIQYSAAEPGPSSSPIFEPPLDWLVAGLETGLLVVADGRATNPFGGQPAVAGEREAWLGAAAGQPEVARVETLDATVIGVVLPSGEEASNIAIEEVAPKAGPVDVTVDRITVGPGERHAIIARPARSGGFPAGLYRVTVSSAAAGGPIRSESWSLEVTPPPTPITQGDPLEAMRIWMRFIDQPGNGAGSPLFFVDASSDDGCGPSTVVTTGESLFGIVTQPGVTIERIRMIPEDVVQSANIPISYAIHAAPRLTVVAFPDGGLPLRNYSLFLDLRSADGPTLRAVHLCVIGA